jgi:hypothetical protein
LWLATRLADFWWAWLALSGAACLLDRLGQPAVAIAPLPHPVQEENDELLRPDA